MVTAVGSMLMPSHPIETHNYCTEQKEIAEERPILTEDLIRQKARENNLNEEKVIFIAKCESQINPNALGDGNLSCKKTNKPMRSRGIWQINECGHPEISDEQAFDKNWSTDWAMNIFKKGGELKEWRICTQKYIKKNS